MTQDHTEPAEPVVDRASGEHTGAEPEVPDPLHGAGWESHRRRVRASPDQIKRRRPSWRRRRRRLVLVLSILGVSIGAALAWLAYTGMQARHELESARAEVHTLRMQIAAGDLSAARATARALRGYAARAHDLTTGPVWATAAAVPFFGDPLSTARVVSSTVDRIASGALPQLVEASSTINPKALRRPDGTFNLSALQGAVPLLTTSLQTMQSSVRQLAATSPSTWLGSVNSARQDLLGQLLPLIKTVQNADVAARTVPSLMGADGPKSYMVSFQNEAELRGLGGLPGAFAILRADRGKLTFTRFESDGKLGGVVPSGVNFGADFDQLYSSTPDVTTGYGDSNLSPHFPYAAQIWLGQWQHKTGQRVDGAITLDPTAVSYLLGATGPAALPDGTLVTAGNVVSLTQQSAYDQFGNNSTKRKQYLLRVARAVGRTLVARKADPTALVKAAARAATEHRLLVWTKDPAIERQLATTAIAGQVPETTAPYAGLAINNAGANKLDYYLHASLDWATSGCGATRDVTVTVRLSNLAPAGLPSYVAGAGTRGLPAPGTNRSMVIFYATNGSTFTSVTVNGTHTGATSGVERGHPAFGVTVDTPVGQPQTIVFHLHAPAGVGAPLTRMQPMINPVQLTVHDSTCSS